MNRSVAWKGADGQMQWSSMAKEDERLRHKIAWDKARGQGEKFDSW
jgi:hypothetical protein